MENKAIRLDTLQEQLRHLAAQPDFVAQFMHEGAYVFADEATKAEVVNVPPKLEAGGSDNEAANQAVSAAKPATHTSIEQPTTTEQVQVMPKTEPQPNRQQVQNTAVPDWKNKVVVLIPPEPSIKEVQLLHKILAASAINEEHVLIQEKLFQAKSLAQYEGSRIVLSFGAVTDFKADYQLRSKAITVIMADKLAHVEADVDAKKKLWAAMKTFFS